MAASQWGRCTGQLRALLAFRVRNSTELRQGSMMRIFMISSALALALAVPAAAQPRSVSNALERLHTLCEQNYKPACIRLGVFIAGLPPSAGRRLRRDHPEWWWWERW